MANLVIEAIPNSGNDRKNTGTQEFCRVSHPCTLRLSRRESKCGGIIPRGGRIFLPSPSPDFSMALRTLYLGFESYPLKPNRIFTPELPNSNLFLESKTAKTAQVVEEKAKESVACDPKTLDQLIVVVCGGHN